MNETNSANECHHQVETVTGGSLAVTVYQPLIDIKGAIIIGPATGIKRQFYQHFSRYLAKNGYGVLTFDNAGIGESLQGKIKECKASLKSWGEVDMPSAFSFLQTQFPNVDYHLVGHSAGGQLIGLMHNSHQLRSVFNVACSSGQLRNMRFSYWIKAQYFMNLYIPLSNLLFGCTHADWVGMGEKLPKRVAQQWREWCNGQGYVKTAFGTTINQHYYDDLTTPIMWVNACDDDIANNKNVADMQRVFTKASASTLTLVPSEHDLKEIGHMKFFSRKSYHLWCHALDWLAKEH